MNAQELKRISTERRAVLAVEARKRHRERLAAKKADQLKKDKERRQRINDEVAYFETEMVKAAKAGRKSYSESFRCTDIHDAIRAKIKTRAEKNGFTVTERNVKKDNGGYRPNEYIGDMAECGIPRYEEWWETELRVSW